VRRRDRSSRATPQRSRSGRLRPNREHALANISRAALAPRQCELIAGHRVVRHHAEERARAPPAPRSAPSVQERCRIDAVIVNAHGQVSRRTTTGVPAAAYAATLPHRGGLGAFQFHGGSRDAALLATLPPGNYSAVVSGVGDTTGVALVEAYDADPDAATSRTRRLVNIATRGFVGEGEDALIAGLVVNGPGPRTFLIRAVGPTLAKAPFNVHRDASAIPFCKFIRAKPAARENDDWDSPSPRNPRCAPPRPASAPLRSMIERASGAGIDAAMLITLQPGSYTAKVSGFEGVTAWRWSISTKCRSARCARTSNGPTSNLRTTSRLE